jgi:hypothetical protein
MSERLLLGADAETSSKGLANGRRDSRWSIDAVVRRYRYSDVEASEGRAR